MAAHKALNKRQERSVVAAYRKGESSGELGKRFGCHRSTIVNIVRAADPALVRRPGSSKSPKAASVTRRK